MNDYEFTNQAAASDEASSGSITQLVNAIMEDDFVLQVSVRDGDEVLASEEYIDASIGIEHQADTEIAIIRSGPETLNGIWRLLEMFGSKLSRKIETGISDNDTIPVFALRLYPAEKIEGITYAEMALPQLWAFSGDSFGEPADHLRIAFPSNLCLAYYDEEVEETETEEPAEYYDEDDYTADSNNM